MIEKLAEYVFRNGIEFEENIKKKNDDRFDFLNEGKSFNKYYRLQIRLMEKNVRNTLNLLFFNFEN